MILRFIKDHLISARRPDLILSGKTVKRQNEMEVFIDKYVQETRADLCRQQQQQQQQQQQRNKVSKSWRQRCNCKS